MTFIGFIIRPQLKRFVLTSSVSAVLTPPSKPWKQRIFDESDWGDECVRIVGELGKKSKGTDAYNASKTLAEQGKWFSVAVMLKFL